MAQQPPTKDPSPARKRTFWIPDDLYAAMSAHVDGYRHGDGMSINRFVREAIEAALKKASR